jgi:hypothetical protein
MYLVLRAENQKPTKSKKQALWFCLLFDVFVTSTGQILNFLKEDIETVKIQINS